MQPTKTSYEQFKDDVAKIIVGCFLALMLGMLFVLILHTIDGSGFVCYHSSKLFPLQHGNPNNTVGNVCAPFYFVF